MYLIRYIFYTTLYPLYINKSSIARGGCNRLGAGWLAGCDRWKDQSAFPPTERVGAAGATTNPIRLFDWNIWYC